jgi:hypothetical protein
MEMMARVLAATDDAEVMLLDISRQFNILKFVDIVRKFLPPEIQEEEFVQAILQRVHIESNDQSLNIDFIPQIASHLTENKKISLVVLDSLGIFYYSAASNALSEVRTINKESYMKSYLKRLKVIADKFEVTILFSKPIYMRTENKDPISTYQIFLSQVSPEVFSLAITKGEETKEVYYKIKESGVDFLKESQGSAKKSQEDER